MLLFTRKKYTAAMVQLASVNGVETVNTQFNVLPSVQQKLETKIQESSEFLSRNQYFFLLNKCLVNVLVWGFQVRSLHVPMLILKTVKPKTHQH